MKEGDACERALIWYMEVLQSIQAEAHLSVCKNRLQPRAL